MRPNNRFDSRIKAEIRASAAKDRQRTEEREKANRAAAARAAADAMRPEVQALARARAAKEERDRLHQGTEPELVWGERAGELCKDFIEFTKKRKFKGATVLKDADSDWSIRGYGVGGYEFFGSLEAGLIDSGMRTTLDHNVFLCVDNKLRIYTHGKIPEGQLATDPDDAAYQFMLNSGNQPIEYIKPDDSHTRAFYTLPARTYTRDFNPPDTVADLPINRQGAIYVPPIGSFTQGFGPEETWFVPGAGRPISATEAGGGEWAVGRHTYVYFKEDKLENVLMDQARIAAGLSVVKTSASAGMPRS